MLCGDIVVFMHLSENGVSSVECFFGSSDGVVEGRVFAHTDEQCCLFGFELVRCGIEIDLCCLFDSDGVV